MTLHGLENVNLYYRCLARDGFVKIMDYKSYSAHHHLLHKIIFITSKAAVWMESGDCGIVSTQDWLHSFNQQGRQSDALHSSTKERLVRLLKKTLWLGQNEEYTLCV